MRVKKEVLPVILFCLGLALQGAGFFVGNLDSYPELQKHIAPDVVSARGALERLEDGYTISEDDAGLIAFRNIFWQYLKDRVFFIKHPEKTFYLVRIEPSEKREEEILAKYSRSISNRPEKPFNSSSVYMVYRVKLPSLPEAFESKRINSLGRLIAIVNDSMRREVHKVAATVFVIGIILQIAGFLSSRLRAD